MLFAASCSETENTPGPVAPAIVTNDFTELQRDWKLTSLTSTTPVDLNSDGNMNTDLLNGEFDVCVSDNVWKFENGNQFEIAEGGIECGVDLENDLKSGTYSISESNNMLTVYYSGENRSIEEFEVNLLSQSNLVMSKRMNYEDAEFGTITVTLTYRFEQVGK